VRLLEGLLEGFMLTFQDFELGENVINRGALGKLFCKAEYKLTDK
jgi:hypothetical protein